MSISVQFKSTFAGLKTVWSTANSSLGASSPWLSGPVGSATVTWTVLSSTQPVLDSSAPASGSGSSGIITLSYATAGGGADITLVQVIVNTTFTAAQACYLGYDRGGNRLLLVGDSGSGWLAGAVAPGSASTLSNSQCTIPGANSSASLANGKLTLAISVQFKPGFAGLRTLWSSATTASGIFSRWQSGTNSTLVTWTIPSSSPPVLSSFTPALGAGSSTTFNLAYSSVAGAADITLVQILVNNSLNATQDCYLGYDRAGNSFLLVNDAGTGWLAGSVTPGAASTLSNSQCTISGPASSATLAAGKLNLGIGVQFKSAFAGLKTIWSSAYTASGLVSGWQSGLIATPVTWTVPLP